jgi:hypothetical protein
MLGSGAEHAQQRSASGRLSIDEPLCILLVALDLFSQFLDRFRVNFLALSINFSPASVSPSTILSKPSSAMS